MTKPKILHIGICCYNRVEGIAEAFMEASSMYHECRPENVTVELKNLQWRPDILFLQVQGTGYNQDLKSVLQHWKNKGTKVVHWSGDIRRSTEHYVFDLAPHVSVTCFSNDRDINNVRKAGYKAEFLQVGIDPKIFTPDGFVEPSAGKIVFLANRARHFPNDQVRMNLILGLKNAYGDDFKLYGNGWQELADGECNVKDSLKEVNLWQKKEAAIYRGCEIAISMSSFTESRYTSDRLFRAMGCGACVMVHEFPEIEKVIPFHIGVGFKNLTNCITNINYARELPIERGINFQGRGSSGYIHNNYTFAHMVQNIIDL